METSTFAGFWLRLVAYIIDMMIISAVGWILGFVLGFGYVSAIGSSAYVQWVGDGFGVLMTWLYFAGFESSKYQGTPGKRIVGIKVVNLSHQRISFGRATGRHFAKLLSIVTIGIGFIMAAFTKKKQGLHDLIARTLVIKN